MTYRGKAWALALLFSSVVWAGIGLTAFKALSAPQLPVSSWYSDSRYHPPKCAKSAKVCVLTGLGGFVHEWKLHVLLQIIQGKTIRVEGICASACEIAYRTAIENGGEVIVAPSAELIYHEAGPTNWD